MWQRDISHLLSYLIGKMNQSHVEVGRFAHSLRVHLFREHLGLLGGDEKFAVKFPAPERCLCNSRSLVQEVQYVRKESKPLCAVNSLLAGVFANSAATVLYSDATKGFDVVDGVVKKKSHAERFLTSNYPSRKITVGSNENEIVATVDTNIEATEDTQIPKAEAGEEANTDETCGSNGNEKTKDIANTESNENTNNKTNIEMEPAMPVTTEEQKFISVEDPVCHDFFQHAWIDLAHKNSEIYEQVFGCLPTPHVTSFNDLAVYKVQPRLDSTDPVAASALLEQVKGFLVDKPLRFLKNEDLNRPAGSKENLVPFIVFT